MGLLFGFQTKRALSRHAFEALLSFETKRGGFCKITRLFFRLFGRDLDNCGSINRLAIGRVQCHI